MSVLEGVTRHCSIDFGGAFRAAGADPSPGGRGLPRLRPARALEGGRRAARGRVGPLDRARRAGGAGGRRLPDPPAHLRRPGPDRHRLPPLRRLDDRVRSGAGGAGRRAGALAPAPRGRRGDAGDDRGAGPGHRPGGDGDGAAAEPDGDDPPGRGAAPAAEQGGGDRDRLDRRRHPPRLRVRPAGRPRPGRVGLQLPEREALRPRRRRADDRQPPRRPRALRGRGRLHRHPRQRLHRARSPRTAASSTSTAPRACSPTPTSPTCRAPTS